METTKRKCSECHQDKPLSDYYMVSKANGTYRGKCKPCMREVKRRQRDPDWQPTCADCGAKTDRSRLSGNRVVCQTCMESRYVYEGGRWRKRLQPCVLCGAPKERFERAKYCRDCASWGGSYKALRRYGMTPAEYEQIEALQNGVCAICRKPDPRGYRLSIDHDHADEGDRARTIRGLLCSTCNYQRLPLYQDDVTLLESAIDYLTNPPAFQVIGKRVAAYVKREDDE